MELHYSLQHYDWGKIGVDSKVAQLFKASGGTVDSGKHYAELWLGTHPSGPSFIHSKDLEDPEDLKSWIERNPCCLGTEVVKKFDAKLPYLFKVLSVNIALSIQMHPSKEHAIQLHREFPEIYKDENHKPELAIALSRFEALCGFKQLDNIRENMRGNKELQHVTGSALVKELLDCDSDALCVGIFKKVFHALMTAPAELVADQLLLLNDRINSSDESSRSEEHRVFSLVYSQFPGDAGCFCVFLFNYVCLEPGQSIFINAHEPHAYLKGDCIECMACSDNVIRAGLTPKYKDITTLCSLLNYTFEPPSSKLLQPLVMDESLQLYLPPVEDFGVAKLSIKPHSEYKMGSLLSVSIALCLAGSGDLNKNPVRPGKAFLIPAHTPLDVVNTGDCALELYVAFANVDLSSPFVNVSR